MKRSLILPFKKFLTPVFKKNNIHVGAILGENLDCTCSDAQYFFRTQITLTAGTVYCTLELYCVYCIMY